MKALAESVQIFHQAESPARLQLWQQHTRALVLFRIQLHHPELGQLSGTPGVTGHHVENQRVKVTSCSWDGMFWEATGGGAGCQHRRGLQGHEHFIFTRSRSDES